MGKTSKPKCECFICGKEYVNTVYYRTNSIFYSSFERIPYCKQCLERLYQNYYEKYLGEGSLTPEKDAVRRLCMFLDIYFVNKVFESAMKKTKDINISPFASYMKVIQLSQYKGKTYDTTIDEERRANDFVAEVSEDVVENMDVEKSVMDFWGIGFNEEDYKFLQKEYNDWTARHECNTKSQEEVFKRLCFKQLEILKATRMGEDTKNLDDTFLKQLEAAKLQPKQNKGDTTSETQTFGTLIDKWENTRPIDEPEEQFKDVDNIGLYLDVFVRGHLSKTMGLKNGLSNLYTRFMKKYTVEKPEYSDDENSEVLFDAIFGNASDMKDE